MLYISPAEVQFLRIMDARVITADIMRSPRTGFPLTIVLSMGKVLKAENVQREVRAGARFIDFGVVSPYGNRGLEIDGAAYHRNVLHEQERDEYCARFGWTLLHIPAEELYRTPNLVHDRVIRFLAR